MVVYHDVVLLASSRQLSNMAHSGEPPHGLPKELLKVPRHPETQQEG